MIEISAAAAGSLARGNQKRYLRVESWYDDVLLDDDIPVQAGTEKVDRALNVPEQVSLTVPRVAKRSFDGQRFDYTPGELLSPLSANGQTLRVIVGIGVGFGNVEWLTRGWFVITESEPDGDEVRVEAAGLLWKIQEARLVNPFQPTGTFKSTIQSLVEPALTVEFDASLADRAVPASVQYDDDRLDALSLTLAAWPAVADVTNEGFLYVTSADDPTEVSVALSTTAGGTVIERSGKSTRDGVYNAVVAQGTTTDGGLVRGVAYDTNGPKRSGGPFNELPVPLFLDSPLITTQAQATAAAASRLKTLKRGTSLEYDVKMVPHPALQAGDLIAVDGVQYVIEQLNLPLTAGGGEQQLRVRTVI